MTYWSIYGLLIVVDHFTACLLTKIPYYFFIKVCFLIWLFNPMTLGATKIYNSVIAPLMKKYSAQIEDIASTLTEVFQHIVGTAQNPAGQKNLFEDEGEERKL